MRWTKEEIEILKEAYKNRNNNKRENISNELSKKLNKTPKAIINKASKLNITNKDKYYTEEEINYLRENIDKMSYKDMAGVLNKNSSNVCRKCKELGLIKTKKSKSVLYSVPKKIYTKEQREEMSIRAKEWYKTHEHPKGFKGHKHSDIEREKMAKNIKKWWNNVNIKVIQERNNKQRQTRILNNTLNPMNNQENPYSRARGGKRSDLNNIYFRSAWEANIARYYNYLGIEWQFEPKTFVFENIKRGNVSYTPDFYLPKEDKWIEVKGWMDGKSKTKLKRFKEQYPNEYAKLQLITEKEYKEIQRKLACFIKNWEY